MTEEKNSSSSTTFQGEYGSIKIDDDVISSIASKTALDIEGVASMVGGMTDGLTEMFGMRAWSKGVKIEYDEDLLILTLQVIIYYGYRIPDIAYAIQRDVSETIYQMTGERPGQINVVIHGVLFHTSDI